MFNLIRRISYGVIPRPDRPWEEDPTSNAPNTKRKRRLSSTERELQDEEDQANKKKARGESSSPSIVDAEGASLAPVTPQAETAEVKEVTKGVDDVHLDENSAKKTTEEAQAPAPESVPLPDENSDELDEPSVDAPISPEVDSARKEETNPEVAAESIAANVIDDTSDVASSSGEDQEQDTTQQAEPREVIPDSIKLTEVQSTPPKAIAQFSQRTFHPSAPVCHRSVKTDAGFCRHKNTYRHPACSDSERIEEVSPTAFPIRFSSRLLSRDPYLGHAVLMCLAHRHTYVYDCVLILPSALSPHHPYPLILEDNGGNENERSLQSDCVLLRVVACIVVHVFIAFSFDVESQGHLQIYAAGKAERRGASRIPLYAILRPIPRRSSRTAVITLMPNAASWGVCRRVLQTSDTRKRPFRLANLDHFNA